MIGQNSWFWTQMECRHLQNNNLQPITNHNHQVQQRGFTLLEVLIALAVFSVSSASLILSDGQAIRQVSQVQNKVFGSWLAEAELNQLYSDKRWPELGESGRIVSFSQKQWYVQKEVSSSRYPLLKQVKVNIYLGEQPTKFNKVYTLTSFVRRARQ